MGKAAKKSAKVIDTHQFGQVEVEPKHIYTFSDGLLGFETLKEFVLISEAASEPFKWLISIEEPLVGFPLLNPWYIDIGYDPGSDFDSSRDVAFVVVTLNGEDGLMHANMKAPIVLNAKKQTGTQIILPSDRYSTNYVLPTKKK